MYIYFSRLFDYWFMIKYIVVITIQIKNVKKLLKISYNNIYYICNKNITNIFKYFIKRIVEYGRYHTSI